MLGKGARAQISNRDILSQWIRSESEMAGGGVNWYERYQYQMLVIALQKMSQNLVTQAREESMYRLRGRKVFWLTFLPRIHGGVNFAR
jgi:hypothetical protein